ncbi:hypothetical protein [Cerasibacillus terrae]|nr:hypothetical protein [Cerasibacillus terrae]
MEENNYSVYFTKVAANDLDNIYRYISEEQKKKVFIMRILYGKRKYEDLL